MSRQSLGLALVLAACGGSSSSSPPTTTPAPAVRKTPPRDPREVHLGSLRQLTFGGENAEAYWSSDGSELVFQARKTGAGCDQIYVMPADRGDSTPRLVSTGKGRTTCSYFFPGARRILYSSTHGAGPECPAPPDMSRGYVWAIYDTYDIYSAKVDGSELRPLTSTPGYDAEATICPRDGSIVFTSVRDGDLELYRMDADGKNVRRLTHAPGYDGGAFFSPDCKQIVWRASRPAPGKELDDYRALLEQDLVRPSKLEIWVADADGTDARQVTYLGAASFGPSFFPDGKRIVFSSNHGDPRGREFELWAVDVDGTDLERITWSPGFDGFPVFTTGPSGTRLAFSSNRNQAQPGDTDVFVADWVGAPQAGTGAPDRILADILWLADDAREGRGVGSAGLETTAGWIEKRFQELGLTGAGDKGFRHGLEVATSVRAGARTALIVDGKPLPREAFEPAGFSRAGEVSAPLVWVEWGITAPELGHDDYKGKNVRGKIAVARRFTPEGGRFEDKHQRRYSGPRHKAWNAREHGARALILVDLPVTPGPAGPLPKMQPDTLGDAGIPVVFLGREQGEALAKGTHRAKLVVELEHERKPVDNVVAWLKAPAEDRLPEVVVIGAHYDHLGLGGASSLAPGAKAVHNGADDNASGVAVLLEVARDLAARRHELRRDVVFIAFTAEEMGALGSTAYLRRTPNGLTPAQMKGMINLDMVGRLRENRVEVHGGESAVEWTALTQPACARAGVGCDLRGDGYGPSDHMPFYAAGVPVLHFFTGAHGDYHRPTDDPDLINAAGASRIASVVADLAVALGGRDARLTYKAAPPPEPRGDMRLTGASLGTVPDYAGPPSATPGVLLAGVRPGGPVELAGLRRGDILTAVDGHTVRNIEDLMFVLQKSRPGEKATVTFLRDGKRQTAEVTFGAPTRR